MKPKAMKEIKGKTVVLTGASRGIGSEISRALAKEGAHLIGVARSQAQLKNWAMQMKKSGVRCEAIAFDLAQTHKLRDLVAEIQRRAQSIGSGKDGSGKDDAGKVDILINNAGIEIYSAFQDYELEEIDKVIRINLIAAMGLTRLLLPHLSAQAHIVNMASLAAKKSHPFDSAYAASKAGLLMWNHSLRQELADTGMGVSAICPGYVSDTGMLADTGEKAPLLAGRSHSTFVARSVLKAIQHRRAEVVVNQDPITETITRGLLAVEQIFPRMNDFSNRWLGITRANRKRATSDAA